MAWITSKTGSQRGLSLLKHLWVIRCACWKSGSAGVILCWAKVCALRRFIPVCTADYAIMIYHDNMCLYKFRCVCVCVLYYYWCYCILVSFWQVDTASSHRLVGADLTGLAWNSLWKICQCAHRAGHLPQRPLWQAWVKLNRVVFGFSGLAHK